MQNAAGDAKLNWKIAATHLFSSELLRNDETALREQQRDHPRADQP
jgi:hypothetical protein